MSAHDHADGKCCNHDHGHDHAPKHDDDHGHEEAGHSHCGCDHSHNESTTISLAASGALVGVGLLLSWFRIGPAWLPISVFVAAILAGGWMLLPSAWKALRKFRPDINLLVVIAAVGASVISQWAEAATVVFLFGVAEWLEGWADRRARRATSALLELAPETAQVRQPDGALKELPVGEVAVKTTVFVQAGQRIPLDGVVVKGQSAVNQAPITGESVPVDKKASDPVFAGTINGEGSLEIEVTKAAGDSTLARIIRLVAEAQEAKAPSQRFVDAFARYYTPAVTVAALLVFLVPPLLMGGAWPVWLYRACALLIIACPCALVISTPVSIVASLAALAGRGVLIKGGAHLESLARLRSIAVDKTGTITEGKPRVLDVIPWGDKTADEVVCLAASIDEHSSHPLAQAIVIYAYDRKIVLMPADNYQASSGRGGEAVIEGHR